MAVKIAPTDSIVDGKTITDWTAEWWKWIIRGPADPFNPSDDRTGLLSYIHNNGPVFFLAGDNPFSGAGNNADRTIVVSHDKEILVPVRNYIDIEGPGITPAAQGTNYKQIVDKTLADIVEDPNKITLNLTIDGKSIDSDVLKSHWESTGYFSMGMVKPGTLLTSFDVSPGANVAVAKSEGYWVMLEGLSRGVHTISFGASSIDSSTPIVQTTDHLIVV